MARSNDVELSGLMARPMPCSRPASSEHLHHHGRADLAWLAGGEVPIPPCGTVLLRSEEMSVTSIDPPIWFDTPHGQGLAHFVIDHGIETDLIWVCFITDTREVWAVSNWDVRAARNITIGRGEKDAPRRQQKGRASRQRKGPQGHGNAQRGDARRGKAGPKTGQTRYTRPDQRHARHDRGGSIDVADSPRPPVGIR